MSLPKQPSPYSPLYFVVQRFILIGLAVITLIFVLTGSKCTQTTEAIHAVAEICGNGIDDDQDDAKDCRDSDCSDQCTLGLVVFPLESPTKKDTVTLSGKHQNAQAITVSVTPTNGNGGSATLTGNTWTFSLKNMTPGVNQIQITAADSLSNQIQRNATIEKK